LLLDNTADACRLIYRICRNQCTGPTVLLAYFNNSHVRFITLVVVRHLLLKTYLTVSKKLSVKK